MGISFGIDPIWASQTDEGRTHIATKGIVQSGLVLNLDAGVSSSYPGSGNTWTDLSGKGNNGTLVNGVGFDSGNGGSLVFNSINKRISSNLVYELFDEYTLSCWMRRLSDNDFQVLIAGEIGNNMGMGIRISSSSLLFHTYDGDIISGGGGDRTLLHVNDVINENTWYSVASTVVRTETIPHSSAYSLTSGIVKLYVNGEELGISSFSNVRLYTNRWLTIAAPSSTTLPRNFIGNVAQASIYNRALTAQEIQQNFNAYRGRFGI
jgi:hypothetical protein